MKARTRINPLDVFGGDLLSVEKPARYLGGEYGALAPEEGHGDFLVALSFPDLYEIGMSNNGIRILYNEINKRQGLRCERVFSPAPDFEALLKAKDVPLYTLESGVALHDVDILGFSIGYELAATNILTILERGKIPRRRADRRAEDPLVLAGGPVISNPHPFGLFMDACYIGEAEADFFDTLEVLAAKRQAGASRDELLEALAASKAFWFPVDSPWRKAGPAKRAVFEGFGQTSYLTGLPVATIKAVQDHGTVEIMRGCPNGCRFCHAGYYYRPQRIKSPDLIHEEVKYLVEVGGYREITLSSLSSGDYPGIEELLDELNALWAPKGVSFQLPSLKISTFNLPLIEKLSEVRKSGLTFAVETPNEAWQRVINKDVTFDRTLEILDEAKAKGFKLAKFYFMIGLPVPGGVKAEAASIIEFFERLKKRCDLQLNVNLGTFVPKAHTPFQWSAQAGEDEALEAIFQIKDAFKRLRGIKLSWHSPFVAALEGVISRGDERVGELIEAAYEKGARLDAWDEHFSRDLWREVLNAPAWKPLEALKRDTPLDASLVWDDITIGVGKSYLKREYQRSQAGELTVACMDNCTEPCGACGAPAGIVRKTAHAHVSPEPQPALEAFRGRIVFRLEKDEVASYIPHLGVTEVLSRAFQMIKLPMQLSEGFNPMPRLELVQPMPLGIESSGEVGTILLSSRLPEDFLGLVGAELQGFVQKVNRVLPRGFRLVGARYFPVLQGKKINSVNSLAWGSDLEIMPRKGMTTEADLEALHGAWLLKLAELGLTGVSLSLVEPSRLLLRLPEPSRKEAGFMRMLETLRPEKPAQGPWRIRRVACLAKKANGEPGTYDEVFETLVNPGK